MSLPAKVRNYLNKYGSTKWKLEPEDNLKFDCAIVIPAISEYENIIRLLNSIAENIFNRDYKVVLIFVINSTTSSGNEIKEENQRTFELLDAILKKNLSYNPMIQKINSSGLFVKCVDASSKDYDLPEKTGGVGFARKIGLDLALTVFDYSKPEKKILVCLDADCTVEKNYINEIIKSFNNYNLDAALINYEHQLPDDEEYAKAITCYEIFLRYYELGLKNAGSEYAFQVVGSTMAFDHEAYIKVEGMNKRKAAEDFYFMEKLAKNYKIKKITSTTVFPSARSSWRVPFGTGQRMKRFLSKLRDEYLLYNPESFKVLKEWLELFNSDKYLTRDDYLAEARNIHPELFNFLIKQNFKNDWDRILLNSKAIHQLRLQKHRWFDGFRTLKLIHHLRDSSFPLLNMFDALDLIFKHCNLPVIKEHNNNVPDISVQKKYLKILRNTLADDN
jgi:cellulose synthase/poly-beta-1,6-N-acetylglucosamine synthase-like glycosyltransferase